MVTENKVRKDYEFLKQCAKQYVRKEQYSNAIDCIQTACTMAKTYYLSYTDEVLEDLCCELADKIVQPLQTTGSVASPQKERWVYYDYFAMDNLVLTQQYLRALAAWGVDTLFVVNHDLSISGSQRLRNELEQYPNITVCTVEIQSNPVAYVKNLVEAIRDFSPTKAFIQTATNDVPGTIAWYALKEIERYFTEAIDHSFWIGAKCYDYYVLFRSYGYNVARKYRNIPEEKLFVQPYYPIYDESPFEGVPIHQENAVKLFSGGRMIKTYTKDDEFFHIVRRILEENPDAVFYFAGGESRGEDAQTTHIRTLIKEYHLENRYILLGFRHDIVATLNNMDIYIGTYPMCGGLMTQLAARCGLPILQYAMNNMGTSAEHFLMDGTDRPRVVYHNDPEAFFAAAKEFIEQPEKRVATGEKMRQFVIEPDVFNMQLRQVIDTKQSVHTPVDFDVDISIWRDNRFETENTSEHHYYLMYIKSKCFLKQKPLQYCVNAAKLIWFSDKKWLVKKIKKVLGRKMTAFIRS